MKINSQLNQDSTDPTTNHEILLQTQPTSNPNLNPNAIADEPATLAGTHYDCGSDEIPYRNNNHDEPKKTPMDDVQVIHKSNSFPSP